MLRGCKGMLRGCKGDVRGCKGMCKGIIRGYTGCKGKGCKGCSMHEVTPAAIAAAARREELTRNASQHRACLAHAPPTLGARLVRVRARARARVGDICGSRCRGGLRGGGRIRGRGRGSGGGSSSRSSCSRGAYDHQARPRRRRQQ